MLALPSMGGHAEQRADGEHAGAADAGDRDIVGVLERRQRSRLRQRADVTEIGGRAAAGLAAVDGDEGRAKTLQARVVLVAGRLVDGALAAKLRLQQLDQGSGKFDCTEQSPQPSRRRPD